MRMQAVVRQTGDHRLHGVARHRRIRIEAHDAAHLADVHRAVRAARDRMRQMQTVQHALGGHPAVGSRAQAPHRATRPLPGPEVGDQPGAGVELQQRARQPQDALGCLRGGPDHEARAHAAQRPDRQSRITVAGVPVQRVRLARGVQPQWQQTQQRQRAQAQIRSHVVFR